MKKIFIYIAIGTLAIFTACDDYVDIVPRGQAIVESLEDVNALLDNNNALSGARSQDNVGELLNDNTVLLETAQNYYATFDFFNFMNQVYNLDQVFYASHQRDVCWTEHYNSLAVSNYICEVASTVSGNEAEKNHYLGEAKVHRVYTYWRLVNYYGVHYGHANAGNEDSGVPLLLQFGNVEESLKRATVNEVYEFLETELLEAIELLRENRPFVDRVNKPAAQALLARVYLHMGKYAEALKLADAALAYNSSLIDYNTLTEMVPKYDENVEHILYKEVPAPAHYDAATQSSIAALGYSESLVAAYDKPLIDLRLSKLPTVNADRIPVITDISNGWPVGVTVPEMMLVKAECLAQDEARINEAMEVITALRAKRFLVSAVENGEHELTATDKQDALNKIFDERRREFHILGMRYFDIKRLNQQYDFVNISLTRGDVTWQPNSINWAIPIGENTIETGRGEIKQNPRE